MMSTEAIVHAIDDDDAVRQSVEFLLRTSGNAARTYASASARRTQRGLREAIR